jgi:transcriptional regulator GlxA family with amidase domain
LHGTSTSPQWSQRATRNFVRDTGAVQVAMVLGNGVSAHECEAYAAVFGNVAGCELVAVGAARGQVVGAEGGWKADATFDEVAAPGIVLVPGGLGCARAAADGPLLDWLRSVAPHCRWLVASSTGSVVVAAAGLLDQHEAATHWLAGPLLESFGSAPSTTRIVEHGRIITCTGSVTAVHVALVVVLREFGPEAASAARAGLAAHVAERSQVAVSPRRRRRARRGRPPGPSRPHNPELVLPETIEFDRPSTTSLMAFR